MVAGVIRVFVTAPDGRTMTIRYCRRGELLGAMSLFTDEFAEPATKQALVDTQLLRMSPTKVRELAHRDLRVARALLVELSERAHGFVNEIPGTVFASVRQRVARQLLDLALFTAMALDRTMSLRFGSPNRAWPTPWVRPARSWSARCASCATPVRFVRSGTGSSCSTPRS